ncbi:hypothetical protein [Bdellovibrio sp.]|uniref:hypothetical protein n=1 Tax=Bdellovibrio sp. TaxID=28201 RepID=UPI0039E2BD68
MKSSGGVIERSDGTFTQMYHPDNSQFKKCQAQGLTSGTRAFDNCMKGSSSSIANTTATTATNTSAGTSSDSSPPAAPASEEPATARTSEDSQEALACQGQFGNLIERCQQESQAAISNCDEKNDGGMNSVASTASQVALLMGQQTSSSITAACSKMADLSQAANAALAAYRLNCRSAQESCLSSCEQAKTFIIERAATCFPDLSGGQLTVAMSSYHSSIDGNLNSCRSLESKINEAQQAIQNYGSTLANASQCAALTSGDPSRSVAELCKATPSYPGCNPAAPVDCSKPEYATTNKICICSKNPHDPSCAVLQKAGGDSLGGSIDSSSRLANSGGEFQGDIPGLPSVAPGIPGGGSGSSIDGHQGGAPLGGSEGGGGGVAHLAKANESVGDKFSGDNSGFYGGGGGRYYGNGSSAGEASGSEGSYRGSQSAKGEDGPDLKKFLPGGQFDPKRGVSGFGGPDGITGPHSNIWQKIQNRYRAVSPTLIP